MKDRKDFLETVYVAEYQIYPLYILFFRNYYIDLSFIYKTIHKLRSQDFENPLPLFVSVVYKKPL